MPSRKKKSVPQRFICARTPLTPMRGPLTRAEVDRLQAHMRKHGPAGLTMRQHNAIWDFLFETPESQEWISDMVEQIKSGQMATQPWTSSKK